MNHILNPFGGDRNQLQEVFSTISKGNTLLMLGAGASVASRKYLSHQIIEYYEDKIGKEYNIPNITEFVDVLSENPAFNRSEFDNYVHALLQTLPVTDVQRTILRIPWRDIITTNFDLLMERADLELKEQSKNAFELVPIRSLKEYYQICDNNQTRYIKLNGCMSDKSKYPFLFSTLDFKAARQFYKLVLESLKTLSDKITFLSVGYSFSDDFAQQLLKSFDVYNYRDKKWIWSVDPVVNTHKLPFYTKNRICIIKCTVEEFFQSFQKWEEAEYANRLKRNGGVFFTSSKKQKVHISSKLSYNLKGVIEQLNSGYQSRIISEDKFYKGEEPSYNAIENGFDVIRENKLKATFKSVTDIVSTHHSLVPIVFLKGNFGTGKTTFNYRLIHQLTNDLERDITAFEILDIDRLRKDDVRELIEVVKSKQIIFYCNNVEIDSVYKSLIDLRTFISSMQLSEVTVYFLLSIRENILELHKKSRSAKSTYEFNIDSKLSRPEIEQLLDKLKSNGLVSFRDFFEKNKLIQKVESDYGSDSFITLLDTITNGKHIDNLRDAFYQLSRPCQKAFVFTALVHQHNLYLPAAVLKNLVSIDWEDFRKNVINVEGRGILIQEDVPFSRGTDPDLYFRTKHPIIANKLIKEIHPREEKRISLYKDLLLRVPFGSRNSRFVVNLLKALKNADEFNESRINQLFDIGLKSFNDDPHFLLQYAINLQNRGTKADLELAIEKIKYAETLLDSRNDRFIHRKGCLYSRLAKLYYKEERTSLNLTFKYLNEAKDWLTLKQQLDPCSAFSYSDLLDILIWETEKLHFNQDELLKKRIQIEELFDLAIHAVTDDLTRILELKERFDSSFELKDGEKNYLRSLEELYEDLNLRPYACILLFNFFSKNLDLEKAGFYLEELESYKNEDEVAKFLFKHYGRNLNDPNTRIKFFRLSREMEWYSEQNPLRYNYNNFVAESYNMQIQAANKYLNKIIEKYQYLNPEYQRVWQNPDSTDAKVFLGKVSESKKGSKVFRSPEFAQPIWFLRNGIESLKVGDACSVNIYFYLNGLRAVIVPD